MKLEIIPFSERDLDTVFAIQQAAFKPLYDKYHDDSTNPYKESKETILCKYTKEGTHGYLFLKDGTAVGAVRVILQDDGKRARISSLCVLSSFQGQGIAQKALLEIEKMHPDVQLWSLDTIQEEAGNCHLYEKLGYKKVGKPEQINDKMTIVYYLKNGR